MTEPTGLRTSALNAIAAAAQAKIAADRGIPRAAIAASRELTGDEIRQAFEVAGLDFEAVLPLVQGYVESEGAGMGEDGILVRFWRWLTSGGRRTGSCDGAL